MQQVKIILFTSMMIFLIGCGGGTSTPRDDDNISVVKLTDLKFGYLVKGIIPADIGEDITYSLGFCNEELTMRIEYYGDLIDDYYGVGTYEIIEENILLYAEGNAMIDTGVTGTFEEGMSYIIEQQGSNNLTWRVSSISLKEDCIPDPL